MDFLKGKKINYKSLIIRLLISIFATALAELGIGCYYGCGFGSDPISVFVDGVHAMCGLSYGEISTICNVILAILIIIFERQHLGIGTLIAVAIGGPLIDVFETLIRVTFPLETTSVAVRLIILLVGLITTSIGYALAIACEMGIGTFQFIPIFIDDKTPISMGVAQTVSDAIFFIIGVALGGITGFGTIVGVLFTGSILDFTLKKTSKPIEKLGPIFEKE